MSLHRFALPPYLLLLLLVHVCVSVNGVPVPYTCRCVCRVVARRPGCACAASVMSKVCACGITMRTFLVDTCCGNFRASVALARWVLCCWVLCARAADARKFPGATRSVRTFSGCRGACPANSACPLGMRWYIGLYTAQGISDKLRELTGYDHGASAVHQALNVIQNALQGTHAIMYFYRYV